MLRQKKVKFSFFYVMLKPPKRYDNLCEYISFFYAMIRRIKRCERSIISQDEKTRIRKLIKHSRKLDSVGRNTAANAFPLADTSR